MMYELMSGSELARTVEDRLREGNLEMMGLRARGYSEQMCSWVERMLMAEVDARPSCDDILREFLQSPLE